MHPYLLTTIAADHPAIIPHFLQHYLDAGIRADRFLLTLNSATANNPALTAAIGVLRDHGITPLPTYLGPYNVYDEKRHCLQVARTFTNADDWIVCCDADEFQCYPENGNEIGRFLETCDQQGYNFVRGHFVDRITATGTLDAIKSAPSIWEQFPRDCSISGTLGGACISKVLAHKGRMITSLGNHYPDPDSADWHRPFLEELPVYHFKWDATVKQRLEYHASRTNEPHPPIEAARFLAHLRKHGRIALEFTGDGHPMLPLQPEDGRHSFAIEVIELPFAEITKRQTFSLEVTIHNGTHELISSQTPYPVHFAYHWLRLDGSVAEFDGERTRLLPPIAPCAGQHYRVEVIAPNSPGRYLLQPTLVQESVRWLDDAVSSPLIPVTVVQTATSAQG